MAAYSRDSSTSAGEEARCSGLVEGERRGRSRWSEGRGKNVLSAINGLSVSSASLALPLAALSLPKDVVGRAGVVN